MRSDSKAKLDTAAENCLCMRSILRRLQQLRKHFMEFGPVRAWPAGQAGQSSDCRLALSLSCMIARSILSSNLARDAPSWKFLFLGTKEFLHGLLLPVFANTEQRKQRYILSSVFRAHSRWQSRWSRAWSQCRVGTLTFARIAN